MLNALFLGDLIDALQRKGFRIVSPEAAYADAVYARNPSFVPAGESLIWALARSDARLAAGFRYPGADEQYETKALGRL